MKNNLQTERLIIRPFQPGDLPAVLAFTSLPETFLYIPEPSQDETAVRQMIERGANNPASDAVPPDIAVTLRSSGDIAGLLSFHSISARFLTMEIGWVFHPAHRGCGYATEAARALVDYGFRVLRLHRIIATCDPRNTASYRVMEKIGMRREAHFKQCVLLADGQWHDEYAYAIREDEWPLLIT